MRMRAATGLYLSDLPRATQVTDVKDADTAEALFTDVLGDALQATVDATARLLYRHDQQVAGDGYVTLPTRANDRTEVLRNTVRIELVNVETVVAAGNHLVIRKCHVSIRETEER